MDDGSTVEMAERLYSPKAPAQPPPAHVAQAALDREQAPSLGTCLRCRQLVAERRFLREVNVVAVVVAVLVVNVVVVVLVVVKVIVPVIVQVIRRNLQHLDHAVFVANCATDAAAAAEEAAAAEDVEATIALGLAAVQSDAAAAAEEASPLGEQIDVASEAPPKRRRTVVPRPQPEAAAAAYAEPFPADDAELAFGHLGWLP